MNPQNVSSTAKHPLPHYLSLVRKRNNNNLNEEIPFVTRNAPFLHFHNKNSLSNPLSTFPTPLVSKPQASKNTYKINNFLTAKPKKLHSTKWSLQLPDPLQSERKHTLNINEILALTSARDKDINHSANRAHERFMEYCIKKCINGCLILSEVCLLNHSSICQPT